MADVTTRRVATRDEAISRIRSQADAMHNLGVTALYLFGSAARDELATDSDVDVFVDYAPDGAFTFVEWFLVEDVLRKVLGRHVDVLTRASLHPRLKPEIERTSVQVL